MSKHTPGPWEVAGIGCSTLYIDSESSGYIANELWSDYEQNAFNETISCPTEEQLANANLIAAAPKLLKVLKGTLSNIEAVYGISLNASIDETTEAQLLEAHEAINKAEGKQ